MSYKSNPMCRTGLRLPDGSWPPIHMNGNRAEDAENILMNEDTYWMYLWRLLDIAISVFKWDGLPEGVDERMLEYWLVLNGLCAFFYDEDLKYGRERRNAPEGYAVLQCMVGGEWDMYNYPTDRTAYATNGLNVRLTEDNSVIVYNDYLRVPMYMTLSLYAKRLAEIDRTIDVNVVNQKNPKVIPVTEQQRLSMKNAMMQVNGNVYTMFVNKDFDVDALKPIDMTAPYVANDLNVLKHQMWNEALTYLGVENVNTEKKERLVSDEIMSNMGDVEAQRFTRLNARQQACEKINELFGLDVSVNFRSGIYIKADGYGSQQIATQGMDAGTVPAVGGGYSVDDVMRKINKAVYGS